MQIAVSSLACFTLVLVAALALTPIATARQPNRISIATGGTGGVRALTIADVAFAALRAAR